MYLRSKLLFILFVGLYLLLPVPLFAGEPTKVVKEILNKVMDIQTDPRLKDFRNKRRVAIKKIIQQNFDLELMPRNALGGYWNKISKKEKKEFENIFQDLFQESYTKMVLDFLKREKIRYESEEKKGCEVIVRTRIVKMEDEIPVDYHLRKVGNKWLVFDVDIDGVSIVGNYRRSFARVIRRTSFKTLMKKMKMQQRAIKDSYATESAG